MVSNIGARVKRLRELSGLGSLELGRLAGLKKDHVGMIEARTGGLYSGTINKILKVFGGAVPYEWLSEGTGDEPAEDVLKAAVEKARAAALAAAAPEVSS